MPLLEALLSLAWRPRRSVAGIPKCRAAPPEPDVEHFFRTPDPGFPDLRAFLPAGSRVLDAGCGAGRNLRVLCDHGFRAIGLDISAYVLDDAREFIDVPIVRADMFALPIRTGAVDAVVAWQVICHFDPGSRRAAVRELARVVAPGGLLLASSCPESAPIESSALPEGFDVLEHAWLDPTPDCPWQRWMLIARHRGLAA